MTGSRLAEWFGYHPPMKITQQLRELVNNSPLTLHRICILADVNYGNVYQFIRGHKGLSPKTLDALGEVLGITLKADTAKLESLAKAAPLPRGRRSSKGISRGRR